MLNKQSLKHGSIAGMLAGSAYILSQFIITGMTSARLSDVVFASLNGPFYLWTPLVSVIIAVGFNLLFSIVIGIFLSYVFFANKKLQSSSFITMLFTMFIGLCVWFLNITVFRGTFSIFSLPALSYHLKDFLGFTIIFGAIAGLYFATIRHPKLLD